MAATDKLLCSFPLFGGLDAGGRLGWSEGNASVREVIMNILLTRPGERLMRPEFGAGLQNFIHHPNNETTRALIADAALRAISRWEPRVTVEEVRAAADSERLSVVNLAIRYRLRTDGSRDTLDLALELGSA
ncbi:MAG: GPW/gp25 family protein [Zoogloea sp.]|nr:GPW/gp25 family protein [Zoogloea sp.]